MPAVIDILVINDCAKTLTDHKAASAQSGQSGAARQSSQSMSAGGTNGIPLKHGGRSYVYLLAPWKSVAQAGNASLQEAGSELQVTITVGDLVRYRMRNLTLHRDYQAFIEQLTVASNAQCLTTPVLQRRASCSTALDPSVATLDQVMPIDIVDSCWEITATQSGVVALNMQFGIYDDNATHQGSFVFSPWLMVQA
jgi:hypothetical protein